MNRILKTGRAVMNRMDARVRGTARHLIGACIMVALLSAGACTAAMAADEREAIRLGARERAHLLEGMRTYLISLGEVTQAIASYKPAAVAAAARQSGAAMLADIPPFSALSLPLDFTSLSLSTHDQFDKLAAAAERGASRTQLLSALAGIIDTCNGCHAAYRLAPER